MKSVVLRAQKKGFLWITGCIKDGWSNHDITHWVSGLYILNRQYFYSRHVSLLELEVGIYGRDGGVVGEVIG